MGAKEKDKSLLEIAIELLGTKHKPQPIMQIAKETMELKGLKTAVAKELLPQFLADFMESGYFVYCGDGCWDLKERQATSILDKDSSDYEAYEEEDEDVKNNELKEDDYDYDGTNNNDVSNDEEENDDEDDDDISSLLKEGESEEIDSEDGVETGFEEYTGDDDDM